MYKFQWLLRMAWRDSRRSRGRLALFTFAIVLGVAALVAIDSFDYNLRRDIEAEAKALLGADLSIRSNQAFPDSVMAILDSVGGSQSNEASFGTMAYFPKSEDNRFVQVRALEGGFPFYGNLETIPSEAAESFREGRRALLDQNLMLQFQVSVGDSVRIGKIKFEVVGKLLSIPGQNGFASTTSTPIFIPLKDLDSTGLIQLGSRIQYQRYYQLGQAAEEIDSWAETNRSRLGNMRLRVTTVNSRQENLQEAFGNMTDFLNLVGFIALLLGCVGVASAVEVYMRDKVNSVAVLRCLGAKGQDAFLIFLIQVGLMGLVGSVLGALLGSALQRLLPWVLSGLLPVTASTAFAPFAVLKGILTGTTIALLFAMLSLLRVRRVSPLAAIRAAYETQLGRDPWRLVVMLAILAFVWGFSFLQVGEWQGATAFTVAMLVSFLLLVGMGRLVMWLVKKFFPHRAGYLWRQSLANLYRPNNQTLILIVSLGLGTGLIATLALIQSLLLGQFNLSDNQDAPNLLVIDVQPTQVDSLVKEAGRSRLEVIATTPVVTMRVSSMRGKSRSAWLADTARDMDRWVLDYEFRVSYRDSLLPSEEVIEGEWTPTTEADGITEPIPISVSKEFAEDDGKVSIGDEMVWDVQGLTLRTVVTSIRKIDYQRLQGAFVILFPQGVLEEAPQFYVLSLRANGPTRSAEFQRKVAKQYPTLSVLDLKMFLNTAEEILDKISFIIQFMALFSILTGLIVLAGSVVISRYQRMREAVLLRTLGASGRQILTINALEYLLLGILATGTGVGLGVMGTFLLAIFTFNVGFSVDYLAVLGLPLGITLLTVAIGLMNSRGVLSQSPLEVLRKEIE